MRNLKNALAFALLLVMQGAMAQQIIWQNLLRRYGNGPTGNRYGMLLTSGTLHPNGGILALGASNEYDRRVFGPGTDQYTSGFAAVRLSASGDSLGVFRIPGNGSDVNSRFYPVIVGQRPLSTKNEFLVITPEITQVNQVFKVNWLLRLDSSGACTDSFPLLHYNRNDQKFRPTAAAIISPTAALIGGRYEDSTGAWGSLQKLNIETGALIWQRNIQLSYGAFQAPSMTMMPGGQVWMADRAGPSFILAILDTNGRQIAQKTLFTAPSMSFLYSNGSWVLPGGRLLFTCYWTQTEDRAGVRRLGGAAQMIVDTMGRVIWQKRVNQTAWNARYNFDGGQIIGVNQDGSFNEILNDYTNFCSGCYYVVRRDSAGRILATWPTLRNPLIEGRIHNGIYAGQNSAYLVGEGNETPYDGRTGYYVSYVSGYGNPYIPTALKSIGGPRVGVASLGLYPNPARGRVQLKLNGQERAVRVLSLGTGQVLGVLLASAVQAGLDLSTYAPGLYLVETMDANSRVLARGRVVRE